jgi:hypothetical protein
MYQSIYTLCKCVCCLLYVCVMCIVCCRFLGSVTRTLGSVAAMTIRNIEVERLPALLIIMRMRSATEIFTVVYGMVNFYIF